jgi:tRNA wybutosine-synthesizing protein 3
MSIQQQQQNNGFHSRKEHVVSSLVEYVDPERRDKSPKGFIDAPILDLMHVINIHPDYYTTSSCSGRVAIYCEGLEKDVENSNSDPNAIEKTTKGGTWLYVSHDPISIPNTANNDWIVKLLFGQENDKVVFDNNRPNDILNRQLIYFKFEPLVNV